MSVGISRRGEQFFSFFYRELLLPELLPGSLAAAMAGRGLRVHSELTALSC